MVICLAVIYWYNILYTQIFCENFTIFVLEV